MTNTKTTKMAGSITERLLTMQTALSRMQQALVAMEQAVKEQYRPTEEIRKQYSISDQALCVLLDIQNDGGLVDPEKLRSYARQENLAKVGPLFTKSVHALEWVNLGGERKVYLTKEGKARLQAAGLLEVSSRVEHNGFSKQ